jgi:heat shock protein HslJ
MGLNDMLRILCFALLVLALAACGSDEDATTDQQPTAAPAGTDTTGSVASEAAGSSAEAPQLVTADDLAGRAFVLDGAEFGGAPKSLAAPIQISFEADQLSAQPGCNSASGGYTIEDGNLTLSGPLAQTRMMCEDQALVDQDAWFASFLEASPQISVDGDAIILTTEDAVLRGSVAPASGGASSPVTADDLAGRAFVLEQAEVGGAPKELAAPIDIAFEADRLSAQPGCNGASGGYAMADGTLTLTGPLAQTMMMCADQALVDQDAWFASVLEASPVVTLDGDAIVLTTDDTVLRGRDKEVANPDLPLEGTVWTITSRIDGGENGAVSSELWMEQSQLTFEPGGRLQGSTACGGVLGTWEADATGEQVTITLEPHGPCTGDQGKLEEQTFSYLSGPLTVDIDADQLTLTRPDGNGMVLKAAGEAEASTSSEPATTTSG